MTTVIYQLDGRELLSEVINDFTFSRRTGVGWDLRLDWHPCRRLGWGSNLSGALITHGTFFRSSPIAEGARARISKIRF